jgi:hypothetical protein
LGLKQTCAGHRGISRFDPFRTLTLDSAPAYRREHFTIGFALLGRPATAHVADQTETFCEDGCALSRRTNSGGLALRRITFLCIKLGRGDAYVLGVQFVMYL